MWKKAKKTKNVKKARNHEIEITEIQIDHVISMYPTIQENVLFYQID